MNTYLIQSRKSGNRVEVEYNNRGYIQAVKFEGDPEETAIDALLHHIARHEKDIIGWYPEQFDVTLVPLDVKFDTFWEAYGKKIGRQNAGTQWQKLNMGDRAKALKMVPKYQRWCTLQNPPRAIVDPERYLKNRRFDDDLKL